MLHPYWSEKESQLNEPLLTKKLARARQLAAETGDGKFKVLHRLLQRFRSIRRNLATRLRGVRDRIMPGPGNQA